MSLCPSELINMICRLTTDTLQDQRSSHTPPQTSPEPMEALSDPKSMDGDQRKQNSKPVDSSAARRTGMSRSTEQMLDEGRQALGPSSNHLKLSRTLSNNVPATKTDDGNSGVTRRAVSPISVPFNLSTADASTAAIQSRPPTDHRVVGMKLSVGSADDRGQLMSKHHPLRQSRSHMSNSGSGGLAPQYFPDAFGNNTLDNRKPAGPTPSSYPSQERPPSRQVNISAGSHLYAKRSVPGSRPLDYPPQTQSLYTPGEGQVFHQKQQSWPMAVVNAGSLTSSSQTISRGPPSLTGYEGSVTNYPYHKAQPISRRYVKSSSPVCVC